MARALDIRKTQRARDDLPVGMPMADSLNGREGERLSAARTLRAALDLDLDPTHRLPAVFTELALAI